MHAYLLNDRQELGRRLAQNLVSLRRQTEQPLNHAAHKRLNYREQKKLGANIGSGFKLGGNVNVPQKCICTHYWMKVVGVPYFFVGNGRLVNLTRQIIHTKTENMIRTRVATP